MKKYFLYKIFFVALVVISARGSAQQPVKVTLRVNYSNAVKLFHDEPVVLSVAISNQEDQESQRWNKAADRRLDQLEVLLKENKISREDYNKQKEKLKGGKRAISSLTLGTAANPWLQLVKWKMINAGTGAEIILSAKPLMNPSSEAVAVLDENGYYVSYFGLSPEDIRKIPGATYNLTAMIEKESSEIVYVEIKNEVMSAVIAESEEMLLKTGQYYWHLNDAVKTMQYADRILAKNPSSLDGLSLKGDGQVLNQSYLPALETYNKAVKEYYKQNGTGSEPPEYLFSMITFVKKELGQ